MRSPHSVDSVIGLDNAHDMLRSVFVKLKPRKILDIPAGHGSFAKYLLELGWKVTCSDIDPGNFLLDGVPFNRSNLNQELPFGDKEFEVVACINGLHRLYNPGGAIREFSRILAPGGDLYINVNNYASVKARLRFLLLGSIDRAVNSGSVRQTIGEPEAHVRNALLFPQIARSLEANGFKIRKVWPAAKTRTHRLLTPVSLTISALSRFFPKSRCTGQYPEYTNSSAILGGGGYMLIHARRIEELAT